MYPNLVPRFLRYVKVNTRSDAASTAVPSTPGQVELAQGLVEELTQLGLSEVVYNSADGFVTATLPSNLDREVRTIGFIAHLDTADFPAENVSPQVIEAYNGKDIALDAKGTYVLSPKDFPNLKNYTGQTLITTDGTTLLGADDKAGIAEIVTAMEYLLAHPEIPHGTIRIAFGPDEEIGAGAGRFDVEGFGADFAYTIDGGPVGELNYETFSAAGATVTFHGQNVHPGTAKDLMVNAIKLAIDFNAQLPSEEAPEHTEGYQGFYHLMDFQGNEETAVLSYILRDHDKNILAQRKATMEAIAQKMNQTLGSQRVELELVDQYSNMREIIETDMSIVTLAEDAMKHLGIAPVILPVRGGTDGSILSYRGLPTPNLFAGGENMHGRYEFVAKESMEKAVQTILEMIRLHAQR